MRNQIFVKQFEDDYNLSRELALLADLSQRAAPVPRVVSTDHRGLTLSMENCGTSLGELLQVLSDQEVLLAVAKSIEAFWNIGTFGVFHADIAPRNVLFETRWLTKAQVIDFNAALCERFPLQKPLWIIPSTQLHHPILAKGIEDDWAAFFSAFELSRPVDFQRPFDIPWDHYRRYWPKRLVCNELLDYKNRILAFGLGGFLDEVAKGRIDVLSERFKAAATALQSCSSEKQADSGVIEVMESFSPVHATPVPKFLSNPLPTGHSSGRISRSSRSWPRLTPLVGKFAFFIAIIFALWATDRIYLKTGAILGDAAFFASLLTAPVLLFLGFSILRPKAPLWTMAGFGIFLALQFIFALDLFAKAGLGLSVAPIGCSLLGLFFLHSTHRGARGGKP